MDAALGRSSRRLQQPGGRVPWAPVRAPGSAMGTPASSSTALASCSRVAGTTMIAGSLLLVSAPGAREGRCSPGAGRVPGPGLREARGLAGWVGGLLAGDGSAAKRSDRLIGGSCRVQPGLRKEGDLFALQSGCAGARRWRWPPRCPRTSGLFPRLGPPGAPLPAHPTLHRPLPSPRGVGLGCGVAWGPAAAAALWQPQCHVGMLPQRERYRRAPASGPPRARRTAFPSRAPPPLPRRASWARVGPRFCKPSQEPVDPLPGASKAPAPSQPARRHLGGGRERERYIKEYEFSPVFPIPLYLWPGW